MNSFLGTLLEGPGLRHGHGHVKGQGQGQIHGHRRGHGHRHGHGPYEHKRGCLSCSRLCLYLTLTHTKYINLPFFYLETPWGNMYEVICFVQSPNFFTFAGG